MSLLIEPQITTFQDYLITPTATMEMTGAPPCE